MKMNMQGEERIIDIDEMIKEKGSKNKIIILENEL